MPLTDVKSTIVVYPKRVPKMSIKRQLLNQVIIARRGLRQHAYHAMRSFQLTDPRVLKRIFPSIVLALLTGTSAGCFRNKLENVADSNDGSEWVDTPQSVRFSEVAGNGGVDSCYDNGEQSEQRSIVESLGGGVGMLDYDQDGKLDLLFPGGGTIDADQPLRGLPTQLWRNTGNFRFEPVAENAEIFRSQYYTHGCSCADYNGDGFTDVLLTGYGGLQLFRNQGDGTFVECAEESGIEDALWSSSAAWGDFNDDGHADLYVAHYVDWSWEKNPRCLGPLPNTFDVCTPNEFNPLPDTIFMNQGDGTFLPVTKEVGLVDGGKGLGVIVADLNGDAHVDIYVANDTTNNYFYRNDGNGSFQELGLISGIALDGNGDSNGSMGVAVFDLLNDLQPDLWVTNYEDETFALYQNNGDGHFLWATDRAGVNRVGTVFVGFGTVADDFDLDGDEDLVVANGHVELFPQRSTVAQTPLMLINQTRGGDGEQAGLLTRQAFAKDSYFSQKHRGRGVVAGDLDGDGDLDLVFSNIREPSRLLANESVRGGVPFSITLIGTEANRDAIGAHAVLVTSEASYGRSVVGGGSYLSQNPYTLTWSIPRGEELIELRVTWPGGQQQTVPSEAVKSSPVLVQQ